MRLCRCGKLVEDGKQCSCQGRTRGTTKQRGYGSDWKRASEQYRKDVPLCQVCEWRAHVRPATEVHHIRKVSESPELRMVRNNWLAVCEDCHAEVENEPMLARVAKTCSTQED